VPGLFQDLPPLVLGAGCSEELSESNRWKACWLRRLNWAWSDVMHGGLKRVGRGDLEKDV
jgi:hypothetical protein